MAERISHARVLIINPKARRSLPKEQRQTDEQAEVFAMQIEDKYKFSSDSAGKFAKTTPMMMG